MGRIAPTSPLSPPLIHAPRGDLPVVLSIPHAGRDYPPALLALARGGKTALATLEDPLVDRLAWRALGRGCGAVIARAPRAAIDCNRAEDELDPAVVAGAPRARLSARARGGLGVVPGRTQLHGNLWHRTIAVSELEQRLATAHRPYHRAIEQALALVLDRFGCALLIDCHSMPPPAAGTPPVIIGDRHGRTAGPWLSQAALAIVRGEDYAAGHNDPFAGGHVIASHGRPGQGVHALQVELDRSCYLDRTLRRPGDGFDRASRLLDRLATGLGEALLARHYAIAAE